MDLLRQTRSGATGGLPARAFTIVELLVVIGVVVVLLSILIVAVSAATRTGQTANTQALMNSIKQALVRFRSDIGYLPPVLGAVDMTDVTPENHDLRKLFDPRGGDLTWGNIDDVLPDRPDGTPNNSYDDNIQEWFSETSLAEYLLGYGHHNQDGYGVIDASNPNDVWTRERPPLGIRNPGADGVWGATLNGPDGSLASRMLGTTPGLDTGKVYGPYLELKDQRLLASADGSRDLAGRLILSFPGEGNFNPDNPKVLVDYWGNPIRYYRKLYAPGSLQSGYRPSGAGVGVPTLSDVYLLRPFDIRPGAAIDGLPDASGDTSTTMALRSAEFALFSPGPDRSFNPDLRYDLANEPSNDRGTDLFNQDNLVELGP